ncbi:MAG: YhjD/YihY/BrkB family envelope integrity protein [Candidatus Brocadiia bacterium]
MPRFLEKLKRWADDVHWEDAAKPKSWVNFARRQVRLYLYIARETVRDRCLQQAAALTFTTLLSLVPLFAVAFSIFRGFAAFEGLEKKAERAIFRTVLAAPLLEGIEGEGQRGEEGDDLQFDSVSNLPAEKLLEKASKKPRQSEAVDAITLYTAALSKGTEANTVRDGLASVYFPSPEKTLSLFQKVDAQARKAYARAAQAPAAKLDVKASKGYKLFGQALNLRDRLNYQDALEKLREAEEMDYPLWKTRAEAALIQLALGDKYKRKVDYEKACNHYQEATRLSTDALFLSAHKIPTDEARNIIDNHNQSLERVGQIYLTRGREQFAMYQEVQNEVTEAGSEKLEVALKSLEEAAWYLENSQETHTVLAEVQWNAGLKEEAYRNAQKATQKSKRVFARGFSTAVADYIRSLSNRVGTAGLGIIGIFFLIVTAISLFNTIEQTLNSIWQVREKRPFWIKFTAFCTLLWLGPALIAASILLREQMAQQLSATFIGIPVLSTLFTIGAAIARYVLPFITVWLLLLAVYKFLPHTRVKFGAAGWGAFVGTILIQLARPGFGLYVSKAFKYQKIYGSLGAIPIFLLWVWLLWVLVLFGAEVAFTVQNVRLLRFRDKLRRLSGLFIDRYLAARMMMYVAREFWKSGEPTSIEKLSKTMRIPPEEASDAADRLVKLDLLTPVGEERDQYHPAKDLSRLTLMEVLSITDRFRDESRSRRSADSAYENKLEKSFQKAISAQREALEGKTFRDLMEECEQEEQKSESDDAPNEKSETELDNS